MKTKTDVFNKKCVTALILTLIVFVCSLTPIFSASSVKAEDGPILSERPQYIFHPSFVRTNGSVLGIWDQPYMAGYMTNDSLSGNPGRVFGRVAAVSVTVSFSGTDNSIIQDGNALAAGIAAQGPSSSGQIFPPEPWIDYGYTMLLVVDNLYDWPFIQIVVWEVLEYGPNNLWPAEDPVVNPVDGFTWENPQALTIDSEVTLTMEWSSNLLFYSATIEGVEYPIYIHYPNDIQHDYFMLGTVEREHKLEPIVDLPGTVKWFQFPGAWSNINIGQVGWHSYLSYPSYKMEGESWTNVPFAYSVNGTTSWLDNTVNWGGLCYDNVNADYTYQHVHFYPTSETTLEPDTLLWDPNYPPNTPSKPDGPTSGETYESYTYSTGTTDPDGDKVSYRFYWGDGSYTTVGPYPSGSTVSTSNMWGSPGTYYVTVRAYDVYGAWSGYSSSLTVVITSGGSPPGGGCPTLFVWDGSGYVDYGVIDIHNPSGEDVIREVPVQAEDVGISNYKATLRLREGWEGLNFSESVIDQVKLYAINEDGKLKLCPLLSATHSRLGDVREYVVSSDDVKVQTLLLETIDLTFKVREDFQGFVFVIEGCNLAKR